MENRLEQKIQQIGDDLQELTSNKIEYAKLSVVERLAILGGRLSVIFVCSIMLITSLMFALIGAAIGVGYLLNNMAIGFLVIAAGILVSLVLINILAAKSIRKMISDLIVSSLLGEVNHED
jgi:hypothetical protein